MEEELQIVLMASLLHDIGKFAQRARRPYSKDLIGEYLPVFKGSPTHWHAIYTDYFIENDLPLPSEMKELRSEIARKASAHHKPGANDLEEICINVADSLSAGTDRMQLEGSDYGNFREARLVSIFDEIELKKHIFESPGGHYYDLSRLDIQSDTIFPKKGKPIGNEDDYISLFDEFLDELNSIQTEVPFEFYYDSLIAVLEKYLWAVPSSSYKALSDISLFDHMISTAGIAQALYAYHKNSGAIPEIEDKEEKFILLGGDLSGIQDYIFGISKNSGKGVSKILRARSFFLQSVTSSIILNIQKRLNLSSVCRLIDSGGKFILILPNSEWVRSQLSILDKEIQTWFRNRFKGKLSAVLSVNVYASHNDLHIKNFRYKLDEANESIETAKLRKFSRTFESQGSVIEEEYSQFQEGNCSICEINAADDKKTAEYMKHEKFEDGGEHVRICRECCDQITYIGSRLPRTKYIVYSTEGKIALFGGIYLKLYSEKPVVGSDMIRIESLADESGFCSAGLASYIPVLRDSELSDNKIFSLLENEENFESLCREEEFKRTKTFSMIAAKSRGEDTEGNYKGRSLLSFFKADVDNLGLIFSMGFSEKLSLARLSTASRMLNLFFSEYIVELVKKECPDIYVVYSGGDDLFLIGPWWQTARFAVNLRKTFSKFCAGNEDITLSGGLFVSKPRVPMRKAADAAEQMLDNAKSHKDSDGDKDSVSILDTAVRWDDLSRLLDIGEIFDKAVKEKSRTGFTMGFLYRLLIYHKMYLSFTKGENIKAGIYLSHAHYDIARNIKNDKGQRNSKKELDLLYRIFAVGVERNADLAFLNIPLFYAMNLNRD